MVSMEERKDLRKNYDPKEDRDFWKKIAKNMDAMTAIKADLKEAGYSPEVIGAICESMVKDGNPNPTIKDKNVKLPVLLLQEKDGHKVGYVKGNKNLEAGNCDKDVYLSNSGKTFEAKESSFLTNSKDLTK